MINNFKSVNKNRRGFANFTIIVIFVLILAVAGGAGYFINKNMHARVLAPINQQASEEIKPIGENNDIYFDVLEKSKGTGYYYSEREYFRLNPKGEKVVVLTVLDKGYVMGWGNYFDREIESINLDKIDDCQIGEIKYSCIKDSSEINILYKAKYTKDEKELFSIEKKAEYYWDKTDENFKSNSEEISQNEIDGLFNDDNALFYKHNLSEISSLAKSGNSFQKAWVSGFLKEIDQTNQSSVADNILDENGRAIKRYENKRLGFEFKYPACAGCEIEEVYNGVIIGFAPRVTVIDSNNLNLVDFVNRELNPLNADPAVEIKNIVIDGESAISASAFDVSIGYVKKGDKIYKISTSYGDTCCADAKGKGFYEESAWDMVISTFTFLK
jgi:hypothetical protein